jgi:hypothetical protein
MQIQCPAIFKALLKSGRKSADNSDYATIYCHKLHSMKAPLKEQRSLSPAIPLMWLGLAVWGSFAMMSYSSKPGPVGAPPARWPAASRVPQQFHRPTLIMFVQPNCPCSKASVGELSLLMTHCQGCVNARVLFLKPNRWSTNLVLTGLWRQASAIPGVALGLDRDGREARLFGAQTSGEVVLYDAEGRLRFQGGMTLSRGHPGFNPGRGALEDLLHDKPAPVTQTPVFGCRLFDSDITANN